MNKKSEHLELPLISECNHTVGYIPKTEVNAASWNDALMAFVAKVDDFNVRGQRDQINHPGYVSEYKFCTKCGQAIDRESLKLLSYSEAFKLYLEEA